MRPLIGITSNIETRDEAARTNRKPHCYINAAYVDAVYAAGGAPLVLPPPPADFSESDFAELLRPCDGLLFTGGPDLDPKHYGQPRHPQTCVLPQRRDRFDIALFRHADRQERPILAICLGCQIASVARGGSLVQHVDDLPAKVAVEHHRPDHSSAFHAVRIDPDSRLAAIIGRTEIEVNSRHHQVVNRDQLGGRLRPVAFAPDGVVEAVEDGEGRFLIAVQWHPEDLLDRPEHLGIFRALIEAASARGRAVPLP